MIWRMTNTPSTRLLNQMLGTSPESGRLMPDETELLKRSKQEIDLYFADNRDRLRMERATLANPDLPVSFVAASLMSLAEPREDSLPFVPRSRISAGQA